MAVLGYKLSSEEHPPSDLVRYARRAEEAGFSFGLISDHFHPWVDRQGHSPFVWSVIGGIATATERFRLGTGVTCPTIRIHPAIIAQAAATSEAMMPGRFFLGVGSGENLNEHILGDRWPEVDVRLEMLDEAIEVIRLLFEGGQKSHHGKHYTIENARLYTLPDEPPPIYVAASGSKAATLAGRLGDGLVSVAPSAEIVEEFESSGGRAKPKYAEVVVSWGRDRAKAEEVAYEWWPNAGLKGQLNQELPVPAHFQEAAEMVTKEDIAGAVVCGSDVDEHIENLQEYADAGYDHLCVHQIGPDQAGFLDFYRDQVLPKFGD